MLISLVLIKVSKLSYYAIFRCLILLFLSQVPEICPVILGGGDVRAQDPHSHSCW